MTKSERAIAARLAAAIKRARTTLGWSQGALAERVGVSTNYISLLERSERLPSIDTLVRLSSELGLPIAVLVGRESVEGDDPWLREATAFLRLVPAEGRSTVLGMLRGAVEAKPQGSGVRARKR